MKEKTVYVIGAGLSAIAGVPVMGNFISKAKDMFADFPVEYKSFASVFSHLDDLARVKNYFKADLFNIEEILSIYDMESVLTKNSRKKKTDFSKFIKDVISYYSFSAKDITTPGYANWIDCLFSSSSTSRRSAREIGFFVAALFNLEISRRQDPPAGKPLHVSRKENTTRTYSIISLNYDCLLESIVDYFNRDYLYDHDPRLSFEKGKYDPSWVTPMLFKIHGDLATGNIIPPTWAKAISSPLNSVWRNAYTLLTECNEIRFIGYSLPLNDTYFQYFLKAAIKNNRHLKKIDVICLDPTGTVKRHYEQVFDFRDFRFRNGNLKDYCQGIWHGKLTGVNTPHTINTLEAVHDSFMSFD